MTAPSAEPGRELGSNFGAERRRLAETEDHDWRLWGPYLSERAWGTVREDYSDDGDVWGSFTHDQARSRTYRWGEDGLAGICDLQQRLCLAFAFWNGRDPILKERLFGLTGKEGNHGEDAKECWWNLDCTPTHSWMRWRYVYPQGEFPYDDLVAENGRRGRLDPEYELIDTGAFDEDRYWDITVDYAKATPHDWHIRLSITNAGPDEATLHVLPTLWFRNTWSWGRSDQRPVIRSINGALVAEHHTMGRMVLSGSTLATPPSVVACENESNDEKLWGTPGPANATRYPKDGINDHVVNGSATVNPDGTGTKAALWYQLTVAPGETVEVALRFGPDGPAPWNHGLWQSTLIDRQAEADGFYAHVVPPDTSTEDAMIVRQALAGMLWSKQFYNYDVSRWLDGDPAGPRPSEARKRGRNSAWRHLNNFDVISMPDAWEYPWYAAWDLAFHCIPLAHVDPEFAKAQLLLICREWYMHPNGQLPAYEWSLGDANPPVHARAAMRVFEIDGSKDFEFLSRILQKLLINFTWWVNREDTEGNNVFEGGFLGLDNIGPIDRSSPLPVPGVMEQSDGTSWMAMYCLDLLEMAIVLAKHDRSYEDICTKFFEHFTYIASAIHDQGIWDEQDGFYYDVLHLETGERIPIRVRSMVGALALAATTTLGQQTLEELPNFANRMRWFLRHRQEYLTSSQATLVRDGAEGTLLSIVSPDHLDRVLGYLLDEAELLSDHGLRAFSKAHADKPFSFDLGGQHFTVDYEPGESESGLFGGNSNWRGPVWFPVNYIIIESIRRFHRFFGDDRLVEFPTSSGIRMTLAAVADKLEDRLVSLFRNDSKGRRPCFGDVVRLQTDERWHNCLWFHEYFHAETGQGLGASHQTGWTGLVADLIISRNPTMPSGPQSQPGTTPDI